MKRTILTTLAVLTLAAACQPAIQPEGDEIVRLQEGCVELQDMEFGMYYSSVKNDTVAIFSVVLSDARCYQDELDNPYMDSDGDMLVLQFRTNPLESEADIRLPYGEYTVSDKSAPGTVNSSASYVARMTGSTQVKWALKSGVINLAEGENGLYNLTTKDLLLERNGVVDTVEYVCSSTIKVSDYSVIAPAMLSATDDIIDIPFPYLSTTYYGQIYGTATGGNFVINMATKGFIEVDDEGNESPVEVPGVCVIFNFFSKVFVGQDKPFLTPGRYPVSGTSNDELGKEGSLMPGMYYDASTPFGTYLLQITGNGEAVSEFITSGYADISYPEVTDEKATSMAGEVCLMKYVLHTSSRTISGEWKGVMDIKNLAESSNESYLTTLDHDVECDMGKVVSGSLRHIETLHRKNIETDWDYDIAEAWQLYLQPRDWNSEEKDIPWVDGENEAGADGIKGTADDWMYDKNKNGIRDRLEAWCADGDVMVLEFILPLGSNGVFAPELNTTYTYTMQPNLALTHELYEIYVSQMGRPADEVFDERYAKQYPGWANGAKALLIESYDRCNARRGFTWSEDGFRGNWYLHYETGQHMMLDEHAPAINGWVKVTRTSEKRYNFEWDFIDDYPGSPNRITGSLKNCEVTIHSN